MIEALIVPFKFHSSARSVTGAATIGGYLGYKFSFFEITDITPFATSGLCAVETTKQQNGQSTTSTAPSFSVGGGGNTGFKDRRDADSRRLCSRGGLGWKGQDYKYEGKPWTRYQLAQTFHRHHEPGEAIVGHKSLCQSTVSV